MMFLQRLPKNLFLDAFWEILYFPIWWYSRGLQKAGLFCWQKIKLGWRALALTILLKNLFKSMYAQHGLDAYILSLGVRFFQLFWRLLTMLAFFVFWLAVFMIWLGLPVFIIWQLIS